MRTCLIASLTFLYLIAFAYGDHIKTLDGKDYYNVKVVSKSPIDITIECTKLPVSEDRVLKTLKLSRLDDSTRKKYGYDNAKADQSNHEDKNEVINSKNSNAFDVPQGALLGPFHSAAIRSK